MNMPDSVKKGGVRCLGFPGAVSMEYNYSLAFCRRQLLLFAVLLMVRSRTAVSHADAPG